MKNVVFFILIFFTLSSFAQDPNPGLFQTWYLHSVVQSDATLNPYVVSEITPEISPTLIINSNLEFTGIGACNEFSGLLNLNSGSGIITAEFTSTDVDCNIAIHNSFEAEYFGYLEIMSIYYIESDEEGLVLSIETPPFGFGVFKNYTLSNTQFEQNLIEIYPNPSHSIVHIETHNLPIYKVEIYHLNGQKVKSIASDFESIEISNLTSGLYIMKISTERGIINKKFIKE